VRSGWKGERSYNGPSPLLVDIVLLKLSLMGFWRGFYTLIKNALFPSLIDVRSHDPSSFETQCLRWHSFPCFQSMWDHPIHLLRGSASSLSYHPMSSSDTIWNSPNSLLVDIVCFGPYVGSHKTIIRIVTLLKNSFKYMKTIKKIFLINLRLWKKK